MDSICMTYAMVLAFLRSDTIRFWPRDSWRMWCTVHSSDSYSLTELQQRFTEAGNKVYQHMLHKICEQAYYNWDICRAYLYVNLQCFLMLCRWFHVIAASCIFTIWSCQAGFGPVCIQRDTDVLDMLQTCRNLDVLWKNQLFLHVKNTSREEH